MLRASVVPLLLLSCSILPAKSHVAERYDVRIRVLPDATLHVTETVRFSFHGGPYTYVSREISKRGLDRITDVVATMDGSPADSNVRDGLRAVRVRWNFDAPAESSHEFTVSYRVEGAVRHEAGRELLVWRAIPDEHDYQILNGRIEIEYPEAAARTLPDVPNAIRSVQQPSSAVFTLPSLHRGRGAAIQLAFRPGFALPPNWQAAALEHRQRLRNNLVYGCVAFLLAGLTAIVLLLRERSVLPPNTSIPPPLADPGRAVANWPPALAQRLAGGGTQIHAAMATLFDLARRGVVAISAQPPGRFGGRDYLIESRDRMQPLLPFESAVLDLALQGDGEFSKFSSRLASRSGGVNALLDQYAISNRLLDPERIRIRRRWFFSGVISLLLGLAVAGAGIFLVAQSIAVGAVVGGVGAAAFAAGLATLAVAARISTRTSAGAETAAAFRALRATLASQARRRLPATAADFERWLPVAVATGLGRQWVSRFRAEGGAFPDWFQMEGDDAAGVGFYDFVAHSSASADASSSGGADGGSGGGSSSAG